MNMTHIFLLEVSPVALASVWNKIMKWFGVGRRGSFLHLAPWEEGKGPAWAASGAFLPLRITCGAQTTTRPLSFRSPTGTSATLCDKNTSLDIKSPYFLFYCVVSWLCHMLITSHFLGLCFLPHHSVTSSFVTNDRLSHESSNVAEPKEGRDLSSGDSG